jgi:hypothetical protein
VGIALEYDLCSEEERKVKGQSASLWIYPVSKLRNYEREETKNDMSAEA